MAEQKNTRGKIGWYVLAILGPAVPIGMAVALFFGFYSAAPEIPLFLILAILGIVLYCVITFFLVQAVKRAGDPRYKPKPGRAGVSVTEFDPDPELNAGIIGLALFRGLFGKK